MNCKKCGNEISENMTSCPACGEPIAEERSYETAPSRKKRSTAKIVASVIGVLVVIAVAAVGALIGGVDIEKTPDDLEYSTYVYDSGDGLVNTMIYGYKNDIVYTYSDIYTFDVTDWAEEEIQELVDYFDSFAVEAQELDCYEYIKTVGENEVSFEDVYKDLGYSENIEAFESIGWFEPEDEDYFISMSMTEETLLADGYVKQ